MRVETRPATLWRRLALAAAIIALALPLTACHATSGFLFCLLSAGAVSPECQNEALAPGAPSPPADVVATSTPPGVDIRWSANLEPDVEGYRIYRSERPGGPYAFQTSALGNSSAALDESAPGCRRLYYVVTAFDALEQESPYSAEAATTCGPPARPEGLRAFGFPTSILLTWSANGERDLAGYNVYRVFPEDGGEQQLNVELLTQPEFHAGGLAPLTSFFFHVRAVDTSGRQSEAAFVGPVKTVAASGVPPTAPTGLTVRHQIAAGSLDWADNPEPDVVGYHVYRADEEAGPYMRVTAALVRDSFYLADIEFEQWLRVTAVNAGNQEGPPSEPVLATPGPAAPTGLKATAGDGEVSLEWDANIEPDLAGYDLYARIVPTGEPEQKLNDALLTATSFRHTGLANGVEVLYRVRAVDTSGNAGPQAETSATPRAGQRPPIAPSGLTATPGDRLVALDWADNPETDLVGYDVEIASAEAGPFNSVLRNLVTASRHTVVDLPLNPWWFRVVAVGPFGRSQPSAAVSATPCAAICTGPALATLMRETATAAGPISFPFQLTVSGELEGAGSSRRAGASIVGNAFEFAGAFRLERGSKGLDPGLWGLARNGLDGTWRARFDWRLTPVDGVASRSGIALATFSNPAVGEACLRFDETAVVKRAGAVRRVVTNGAFTFLGGTEAAAKLLGGGSYRVETRPDGSLLYAGKATPAAGGAPMPAECLPLETR